MIGKEFILAGAAVFTIEHEGRHYTYRVSRKDGGEHCAKCDGTGYWKGSTRVCFACKGTGETQPVWFVGLLTGPDNEADYTYMGILDVDNGELRLTKNSRYTDNTTPVVWFRYVVLAIWIDALEPNLKIEGPLDFGWKVHHEGRCGRCGRPLTTPESVSLGLGPVCAGRM